MRDNPQPSDGAAFALPDHHVVSLSGRDAAAFAQAQFMNDVAGLAPGQWQWSGWLTPKGRVIALFALLRVDEQTLWLVLPDADPASLAAALQRFVFRSKLTIEVRGELRVEGGWVAPSDASGARIAGTPGTAMELDVGAEGGPRTLRIVAERGKARTAGVPDAGVDAENVAAWLAFDLEHGLPRLPASQADRWTPQQLSLERLRAFSVKKGCYPGQEIVARTHFLGKVKRGLALFAMPSPVDPGSSLVKGSDAMGEIVAVGGGLALAVLGLDQDQTGLEAAGVALRTLALRPGLER